MQTSNFKLLEQVLPLYCISSIPFHNTESFVDYICEQTYKAFLNGISYNQ